MSFGLQQQDPMSSIDLERERQRLALDKLSLPRFAGRESSRPFVVALEGPNAAGGALRFGD